MMSFKMLSLKFLKGQSLVKANFNLHFLASFLRHQQTSTIKVWPTRQNLKKLKEKSAGPSKQALLNKKSPKLV